MLKIRLQRQGRKNDPSFKVVITERQNATKSGKFLEVVGVYDIKKGGIKLEGERIKHWLSKGAQPSGTVHNLLVDAKLIVAPKMDVSPKAKKSAEGVKAAEKTKTPA
ncbi:MAG: 30S ribosomal protein S16 [Candidatus Niyogibacteria bacterium]|nr:30S ribosomal protein S16 [Candidatus Niyogibacteria bacterium]